MLSKAKHPSPVSFSAFSVSAFRLRPPSSVLRVAAPARRSSSSEGGSVSEWTVHRLPPSVVCRQPSVVRPPSALGKNWPGRQFRVLIRAPLLFQVSERISRHPSSIPRQTFRPPASIPRVLNLWSLLLAKTSRRTRPPPESSTASSAF